MAAIVIHFAPGLHTGTHWLDKRYPSPPLLEPATRGLATVIEAWVEEDLFWPLVRYVSGTNAETVDPQLHVDRAAIRGKAPSIERLKVVARRSGKLT